jgi:hypothetical protein
METRMIKSITEATQPKFKVGDHIVYVPSENDKKGVIYQVNKLGNNYVIQWEDESGALMNGIDFIDKTCELDEVGNRYRNLKKMYGEARTKFKVGDKVWVTNPIHRNPFGRNQVYWNEFSWSRRLVGLHCDLPRAWFR